MDFKDISAGFKRAQEKKKAESGGDKPYDFHQSYQLRSKMLGVLIRDARVSAERTVADCAHMLHVEDATIEAWEYGDASPDLPQLELLAAYLDVPVSHFWSQTTLQAEENPTRAQDEYIKLRQRMIGALLRNAREAEGLSVEDVASAANLPVETIVRYELGDLPIPMHELPVLSNIVNKNIDYFLETSSYVGELLRIREEWKQFTDLDEEIRAFAANPLNVGFIKIAITFSKMSAAQLRQAAEGMLEIAM